MSVLLNEMANGLAFGGLLFILGVGFTLSLGLMNVVNIAHGAFYMLGAYLAISTVTLVGNFWIGLVVAALGLGLMAFLLQFSTLRWLGGQQLRQVLFTFGLSIVIAELCRRIWGSYPALASVPDVLKWTVSFGGIQLPAYRVFVFLCAIVLAIALGLVLTKTMLGAKVRACLDDRDVARVVGIKVEQVFALVFTLAGALAGLAGGIGAPFIGAYQGVEFEVLALTLVVVVVGGPGSILGALVASMIVGVVYTMGIAFLPELSYFLLFGPMILILLLRPSGLFGRKDVSR